jgi:hypothetical protein
MMPREKETFQSWTIRSPKMKTRQSTKTSTQANASTSAAQPKTTVVAEDVSLPPACNSGMGMEENGVLNSEEGRVGHKQKRLSTKKAPKNHRQPTPKGMKRTPIVGDSGAAEEAIPPPSNVCT